jgi:hypothetical protein
VDVVAFTTLNMSGEPLLRILKNTGKCWFMVMTTHHYLKKELLIVMSGVVINAKNAPISMAIGEIILLIV